MDVPVHIPLADFPLVLERLAEGHATICTELRRFEHLLAARAATDERSRAWRREVGGIQLELERELLPHVAKEQQLLFPYARRLVAAVRAGKRLRHPPYQTARNPIRILVREHEAVAIYAARLDQLFAEPFADAPAGARPFVAALRAFIVEEIALEERVLFPTLIALERDGLR